MHFRSLGRTGVMVSSLCLGTMNFGGPTSEEDADRMINSALDAGINFIDTADSYVAGESEQIIGRALKANARRDQIILASKFHFTVGSGPNDQGNSRYHIQHACEDSLRRLQTDRIDLYQVHRPSLTIPQDETLRALDDLVRQGKVLYVGCSTFPAWMVMEALAVSERYNLVRFVSEQPPYNLLDRLIENELVPLCLKFGLGILPWSPLAMGILAGRYPKDGTLPADSRAGRMGGGIVERVTRHGLAVAEKLSVLARERGITPTQLALLWVKDQPGVTAPIIGPRTLAQLHDALPVLNMSLSGEDRKCLDELVPPGSMVSNFHNTNPWMKMRLVE